MYIPLKCNIEKRLKTRVQNDVLHTQKIQIYQILGH